MAFDPSDPFGVVVEHRLGEVFAGDPQTVTISVVGVAATAGVALEVQVPTRSASLDRWTTIGSTTTT